MITTKMPAIFQVLNETNMWKCCVFYSSAKKNNENDSNALLNYVAEVILFKRMNKLSKNQILIVQLQHVIKKPKYKYIFEYCIANMLEAKEYI